MMLLNDPDQMPDSIWEAIHNYVATHHGDRPRFVLAGRTQMRQLKLMQAPILTYVLVAESVDERVGRWFVFNVEVVEVERDSFWEIVG